jgi:hypothetical protein
MKGMRRQALCVVVGLVFGALGGAMASGLDETAVIAKLTSADHEVEEGYFSVGEAAEVVARPGSALHQWLSAHRDQKVRLLIQAIHDGDSSDPDSHRGLGRDSGVPSAALRR